MRVGQVPQGLAHRRVELITTLVEHLPEGGRLDRVVDKVCLHRLRECVVIHRGQEPGPLEIISRAVTPDFGDRDGIGVDAENKRIPIAPKLVGNLLGNVETPAVDAIARVAIAVWIHPALRRVEDVFFHRRMQIGAVFVVPKLRQRVESEPSGVTQFVAPRVGVIRRLDGIPFHVRRLFTLHADVAEGEEVAPRVIEDAVDHDLDTPFVGFFDQLEKQFVRGGPFPRGRISGLAAVANDLEIALGIGTEIRIDVVEGVAVVFVL